LYHSDEHYLVRVFKLWSVLLILTEPMHGTLAADTNSCKYHDRWTRHFGWSLIASTPVAGT